MYADSNVVAVSVGLDEVGDCDFGFWIVVLILWCYRLLDVL